MGQSGCTLKQGLLEIEDKGGSEAEMIALIEAGIPAFYDFNDAAEVLVVTGKDRALSALFNAFSKYEHEVYGPIEQYLKKLAHRCTGAMMDNPDSQLSVKCLDVMIDRGFDIRSLDACEVFMRAANREDRAFCLGLAERGASSAGALGLAKHMYNRDTDKNGFPKAEAFLKALFPWTLAL